MKWILAISSVAVIVLNSYPARDLQSRYMRVESYEIRPGVLATPAYSKNGALCEVSIEKRHVQRDTVDLGSTIPRKVVLEMIDELAPPSERGKATVQLGGLDYMDVISGSMAIATAEYQNVSVRIFRTRSESGDTAVVLKWKNDCGSRENS